MEDTSKSLKKHYQLSRAAKRRFGRRGRVGEKKSGDKHDEDDGENEDEVDEGCDVQAWETLSKSFNDVQSVLDHNRVLINIVQQRQALSKSSGDTSNSSSNS
ncbi:uncharacterized protein LOC113764138 [Coffea eugenioides]|uniref:uncharacterized protein LOC113764138 n=1 Tax=Coffea eugenioides TaxID=49369 RepID=UPI000F611CC0|nr:uncharacterized protein LOC113764138 [Coffea eugenioides]